MLKYSLKGVVMQDNPRTNVDGIIVRPVTASGRPNNLPPSPPQADSKPRQNTELVNDVPVRQPGQASAALPPTQQAAVSQPAKKEDEKPEQPKRQKDSSNIRINVAEILAGVVAVGLIILAYRLYRAH